MCLSVVSVGIISYGIVGKPGAGVYSSLMPVLNLVRINKQQ